MQYFRWVKCSQSTHLAHFYKCQTNNMFEFIRLEFMTNTALFTLIYFFLISAVKRIINLCGFPGVLNPDGPGSSLFKSIVVDFLFWERDSDWEMCFLIFYWHCVSWLAVLDRSPVMNGGTNFFCVLLTTVMIFLELRKLDVWSWVFLLSSGGWGDWATEFVLIICLG